MWNFLSSCSQKFHVAENSEKEKIVMHLTTIVCGHGGLMHELHKPRSLPGHTMQHSLFNQIKSPRTMVGNFGLHHGGRLSYPDNCIGIWRLWSHRAKILPSLKLLSAAAQWAWHGSYSWTVFDPRIMGENQAQTRSAEILFKILSKQEHMSWTNVHTDVYCFNFTKGSQKTTWNCWE